MIVKGGAFAPAAPKARPPARAQRVPPASEASAPCFPPRRASAAPPAGAAKAAPYFASLGTPSTGDSNAMNSTQGVELTHVPLCASFAGPYA